MNGIPRDNIGEDDFVLLQFGLHFAPARGSDCFKESFDQFIFCRITETLASEMLNDYIYIGIIDRTKAHRQSLLINLWCFNRNIVGIVEVPDDAVDEVLYRTVILAYKFIHNLEWLELVMRVVLLLLVVVVVITTDGITAVLLILELDTTFVLVGFRLEDVVPTINLVERLVKLVLLVLAIDTVLLRNLVLVSHLYLQDT